MKKKAIKDKSKNRKKFSDWKKANMDKSDDAPKRLPGWRARLFEWTSKDKDFRKLVIILLIPFLVLYIIKEELWDNRKQLPGRLRSLFSRIANEHHLPFTRKAIIALVALVLLIVWQYVISIFPSIVASTFFEGVAMRVLYFLASVAAASIFLEEIYAYGLKWLIFFPLSCVVLWFVVLKGSIRIEMRLVKKEYTVHMGRIADKYINNNDEIGDSYYIKTSVNNNEPRSFQITKEKYDKLELGDTILILLSERGGSYIWKYFPTHKQIEKYKVPQHYINGKLQEKPPYGQYSAAERDSLLRLSHNQIGFVFEITDDEYFRHLVKVGTDAEYTTTHEFYETDADYSKVYKRLKVGDTVILQVSYSAPEVNRVLCWHPDETDIEKYISYKPLKDYSHCGQQFEDELLLNSHKRLAFVYDKYRDSQVGAYLEVGIDKKHIRTYQFKTFEKEYKEIYKTKNIGDAVVVQVSDYIPQLNRVLNWNPSGKEIFELRKPQRFTYRTIAYVHSKDHIKETYAVGTTVKVKEVRDAYRAKLRVGNTITGDIKIINPFDHQIYKLIKEGDPVLAQMIMKDGKRTIDVFNWRPTPEELDKFKQPITFDADNVQPTDSVPMPESDYYVQTGYIFRKDLRGITKQFNTMVYVGVKKSKQWKHEMNKFENIHVGDTILLMLSDRNPNYNEVISWCPTPEEKQKYMNPVRLVEKK